MTLTGKSYSSWKFCLIDNFGKKDGIRQINADVSDNKTVE